MSTLTATPPPMPNGRAGADTPAHHGADTPWRATQHPRTRFDGAGGGQTLDDVVSGAWEELTAHAVVACPLCDGALAPEYGSHARPIGGRCKSCDTRLG